MMCKKRGIGLMILGCMFLTGAMALFLYNNWQSSHAAKISKNVVEVFHKELKNNHEISDKALTPNKMDTIVVDNNKYVGIISIPSLQLELPVEDQWSYSKLKISPCRYKGNIYDGSMIIIAHNYESHFGKIYSLNSGDKVLFTDTKGYTYNFVVTEISKLDGTAIEEMEKGNWDLTLFTCTYGGKQRVTVRCIRT